MEAERWLVAGLGNPGRKYEQTRHNVGFMLVDRLDRLHAGGGFGYQRGLKAYRSRIRIGGTDVILLKPDTYMNLSGVSVRAAASYFKILPQRTVICYDDVDISCGLLRIRVRGSAGGHRGMASVIEQLGDDRFVRLRLGIRPDGGWRGDLAGFVLAAFRSDEHDLIQRVLERAGEALELIVSGRVEEAMNRYNGRTGTGQDLGSS